MVRENYFLRLLLVVVGLCFGISSFAMNRGPGDDTHPWPWGLEVPFPWEDVQGVWKVESHGNEYYFGFRRTQEKRLVVTQFDASRCVTLGSGPGLIRSKGQKYVVAQITMKATGDVYRMAIYAFAEEDSPEPPAVAGDDGSGSEHVVVARITNMSSTAEREMAVQMARISDRLEFKCLGDDKKLKF
jgi:hypothetical protein